MFKRISYLFILSFLLILVLAACRRDEEDSTPQATAEINITEAVMSEPTEAPPISSDDVAQEEPKETYDWTPQIVYSTPLPGDEVKIDESITVRFDQPMDQVSVEEALSVGPIGEETGIDGSVQWPRPDMFIFTPEDQLEREQLYQVQIKDTARASSGKPLLETVNLSFDTVGFLEVSQVIPEPNNRDIQTDTTITVMFNRPVVPLVSTGQQAELPQPLTFEPAATGQGEWVSTSIYRFMPDPPLAGATQYQVTVQAGLEDVTGGILAQDYSWRFTTLNPSVVSTTPEHGASEVDPARPITVTFNMPMEASSTEASISLQTAAQLNFSWSEDGRIVTGLPISRLDLETSYELNIAQSARSANGQAPLDRTATVNFSTVPYPAILGTSPEDGDLAERYQQGVSIRFASPMDLATLENQVTIQPAPEEANYYFNEYDNSLHISFDIERNATYEITVPGTAADPYGNTLGEDYSWQFTTAGYDPLVSLNLPDQVSQLSTSYPSDVDVIYRNISSVDAALYDAGLPVQTLVSARLYDYEQSGEPLRTWSIPVETVQDEANVLALSLADGGTLPTGVYLLEVGAPQIEEQHGWWQNHRNMILIADTNLVVKEMFNRVYVWATTLVDGQPAAGLSVALYNDQGNLLDTAVTDGNGLVDFAYRPGEEHLSGVLVVSSAPGEAGFGAASSNWSEGVMPWQFGINTAWADESEQFVYLYTDRPIYRPGDTVYYRGIVRDTNYGRYPFPTIEEVTVEIDFITDFEATGYQFEARLDENGEFAGEYQIPSDSRLGTYRLYVEDENVFADRTFTVAEYRKPEFQVEVVPDQSEALRGEVVDVVIEASYFFGGPASDLPVNWIITEKNYWLPWDGPYYSFGDSAGFFDEENGAFFFGPSSVFGTYLVDGEGRTDSEGRLVIELPADLLEEVGPGSREVTVEASVFDISEFPIASRASVVFHDAETYVGVVPDNNLGTAGTSIAVDLITVDWGGESVPNGEVEVVFYRREWKPTRVEEFDQYTTRWEVNDEEVDRVQVTTNNLGQASTEFIPPEGGSYLAVATVTDNAGRSQTSSTMIWVADSNYVGWRSDPTEKSMDLVSDKQEYSPGDSAQILVQSPFDGPVRAWLTIERGELLEQQLITLQSNSDVLEIPIIPGLAPNAFVSVHAVKGVDESNPYASMRLGITELVVSPEQLALDVTLTAQSELLQPGDVAVYDVLITDHAGNPVQANFSLALVDLAVLTLKEDNAPDILQAFYERQPMRSQTGAGLIVSGEGLEVEIPLEVLGRGGGGGGELEADSAFALEEEEDATRSDFPDTAFWEAKVSTDASGRATVEIPLPDSVTTWRLSSKAVSDFESTKDTLVGQESVDIVSTLPLLIRPVTPRFFTVGDHVQLGAVVHNNTENPLDVTVSLEASGLTLEGTAEQEVSIPSGGLQLVRWPVVVDDELYADLTFRAESGEYRDATKPTFGIAPDQLIPIVRFTGEDVVGTSGVLDEAGRRVEAILLPEDVDTRQGQVRLQLSPSLAAALTEALDYVNNNEMRPACAHAIAYQLLPNAATILALQDLSLEEPELVSELARLIPEEIQRLDELQKRDGGWGWCYTEDSDPYLSAYVLLSLAKAGQAGFSVDQAMLNRGARYLQAQIEDTDDITNISDANQQAFYLYVLAELEAVSVSDLDGLFSEHRGLMDPYAKALLAMAYDLAGSSPNERTLLADLNDSVILSATGAHWEDEIPDWDNLSSDIRGTAMIISALSRLDANNPLVPNAVRWLMVARTAGHWPTAQEDAWSIMALTEWMAATSELEADYEYQVDVNGAQLLAGEFNNSNVTENENLGVDISDLQVGDVNFFEFQRGDGDGRLYYTAHLDSFIRAENLEPVNRGFIVQRTYYDAACDPEESECQPIDEIEAGQQVRVELNIIVPHDQLFVMVEDPIPAGAEAIDPGLETTASDSGGTITPVDEEYRCCFWGWWYFDRIEYRDDKVVFLSEFLPAGTYQYSYTLQTVIPGEYQVNPATARQEFFPEVFGRSDGFSFRINE